MIILCYFGKTYVEFTSCGKMYRYENESLDARCNLWDFVSWGYWLQVLR